MYSEKIENNLKNTENNIENNELIGALIEIAISHSYKVNEGNNGIICKLNLNEIPSDLLDSFTEDIEGQDNDLAVKMLKIYTPGTREGEVKLQQKAYDCINNQKNKDDFVKVPKIWFSDRIQIKDQELIKRLQDDGVSLFNDSADMIMMDYINGDDLATHIYKQIANIHPALRDIKQRIKQKEVVEFSELQERIAMAFNFSAPGGKSANQAHRKFEELKVFQENADKVFNFMEKNDIVLDKKIYEKVNNTIHLFDKNNIYHPDLHERNCMLTFNKDGKVDDVFIIDYDPSQAEEQQSNSKYLSALLKRLTSSNEQKNNMKNNLFRKQLSRLEKSLENNSNWYNFKDEVDSILSNNKSSEQEFLNVMSKIQSIFSADMETNIQVIGLILTEMKEKYGEDKIKHFVKLYKEYNKNQPFILDSLKKFDL